MRFYARRSAHHKLSPPPASLLSIPSMKPSLPLLALLATLSTAFPAEPPLTDGKQAEMLAGRILTLQHLSRSGDRRLFSGDFKGAVADFERMIALDPAEDAPHWRLGIAYHFAGDFAKSARQFEKYHAHDGRDRENGIWKFLADVKVVGIEKARTQMLPYTRFDREPFPALYEIFAGRKTTDEVFAEIAEKKLGENGAVMFFAHYYGGLNEALLGHPDRARELLAKAVASPWGQSAEGGPAYMWQAARLHYEALAK